MCVNTDGMSLGEPLALLPDEREADRLEAEMDAAIDGIDRNLDGPERLVATVDRILAAARRVLADGTAVLGRPARTGNRLTTRDKLDLLPPFEATKLRAEWQAKKTIADLERVTLKIDAAYDRMVAGAN